MANKKSDKEIIYEYVSQRIKNLKIILADKASKGIENNDLYLDFGALAACVSCKKFIERIEK